MGCAGLNFAPQAHCALTPRWMISGSTVTGFGLGYKVISVGREHQGGARIGQCETEVSRVQKGSSFNSDIHGKIIRSVHRTVVSIAYSNSQY